MTDRLSLIAEVSRNSVDAMSDIVWAVNPRNDHLADLIRRMRRFASDSLDARNIAFPLRRKGRRRRHSGCDRGAARDISHF
jgi:hypothetical protein